MPPHPGAGGLPILFLTAKTEEADVLTGLGLGGDDYLTKPFRPTILLMKVRAAAPGGDGQGENSGGSR